MTAFRRLAIIAAIVLAAMSPQTGAHARPLPNGGVTIEEMARVLQGMGLPATIDTYKSNGRKHVLSNYKNWKFYVDFYNCGANGRCPTIQFNMAFDLPNGFTLQKINEWNMTKRFASSYIDDERDPWIKMDLDVEKGYSTEALENNTATWLAVMEVFDEFTN